MEFLGAKYSRNPLAKDYQIFYCSSNILKTKPFAPMCSGRLQFRVQNERAQTNVAGLIGYVPHCEWCNRCPAANSNLKKTGKPTIKWGGHRWRIDNGEPANQTETNRTELKSNRTKPKGNDQSTKLTNKEHGLRLKTIESKKKRKECAENDQLIESKKKRKERSEDGNQLIGLDGNDAEFVKSNESEQLNASGEVTIDDKLDEGEEAECTADRDAVPGSCVMDLFFEDDYRAILSNKTIPGNESTNLSNKTIPVNESTTPSQNEIECIIIDD